MQYKPKDKDATILDDDEDADEPLTNDLVGDGGDSDLAFWTASSISMIGNPTWDNNYNIVLYL